MAHECLTINQYNYKPLNDIRKTIINQYKPFKHIRKKAIINQYKSQKYHHITFHQNTFCRQVSSKMTSSAAPWAANRMVPLVDGQLTFTMVARLRSTTLRGEFTYKRSWLLATQRWSIDLKG